MGISLKEIDTSPLYLFEKELRKLHLWPVETITDAKIIELAKWILTNQEKLWEKATQNGLSSECDDLISWAVSQLFLSKYELIKQLENLLSNIFKEWTWDYNQEYPVIPYPHVEVRRGNLRHIVVWAYGRTHGNTYYHVKIDWLEDGNGRIENFNLQIFPESNREVIKYIEGEFNS